MPPTKLEDEIRALRDQLNDAAANIHPWKAETLEEMHSRFERREYYFGAAAALTGVLCAVLGKDDEPVTAEDLIFHIRATNEFLIKEPRL
jgi:hypothetical protein